MPSLTSRLNIRASLENRIVPRTRPRLALPLSGVPVRPGALPPAGRPAAG